MSSWKVISERLSLVDFATKRKHHLDTRHPPSTLLYHLPPASIVTVTLATWTTALLRNHSWINRRLNYVAFRGGWRFSGCWGFTGTSWVGAAPEEPKSVPWYSSILHRYNIHDIASAKLKQAHLSTHGMESYGGELWGETSAPSLGSSIRPHIPRIAATRTKKLC